jgi:hypothetical protein
MQKLLMTAAVLLLTVAWTAPRPEDIPFAKHEIDNGANETCAFADINGDGKLDIVSGENWYEAPKWTKHKFREINFVNGYVDAFSDLPIDVDGDGFPDLVTVSWFSKKVSWWRNPGKAKRAWAEAPIETGHNVEFAFLVDLDNDGKARELLPQFGNVDAPLAWYELENGGWVKHVIAPKSYPHGIGAGDINGDGRADIITPRGWFEAPPDPRAGDWKFHPDYDLGQTGFIYARDVNGDGRMDLVTTMAHDYGVLWFEQTAEAKWIKHVIDDTWSQAHAMTLFDWFGDGRRALLTGKRYMAHDHDPGVREPLGIYWYESRKAADGKVEWVRHIIDYSTRTGAGMQIAVADFDGDGDLDFAVGGKSGVFLFENLTRK